jgi:hypothetical protein
MTEIRGEPGMAGGRLMDRTAEAAPLVSVNIPCYRQLHYFRECLDSVLAQTSMIRGECHR